jgi:hypothetical protein
LITPQRLSLFDNRLFGSDHFTELGNTLSSREDVHDVFQLFREEFQDFETILCHLADEFERIFLNVGFS